MQTAKQLDSHKFPPNVVDVMGYRDFEKIQNEVKEEVRGYENSEMEMFDNMIAALRPKTQEEQSKNEKKNEKILNDREVYKTILRVSAEITGVPIDKIKEKRRHRETIIARYIIVFLTRWTTDLTMDEIGRAITNGIRLYHSTIYHACVQIKNAIETKKEKVYPLLQRIILQLRTEGINIDFRFDQPKWYQGMKWKEESGIRKILITG